MKKHLNLKNLYRLLFSIIFSFALFYMNKIVFLGYVFNENYMDVVFLNEFKVLLLVIPIVYSILWLIEKGYKSMSNNIITEVVYKNKKLFCLVAFVFLLVVYLAYYLSFYPGGVYIDTWTSLQMLNGEEDFTAHQSVLYTLMLNIVKLFGSDLISGFAVFTFIQIVLMVATITYFLYWLLNKKVNPAIVLVVTMFFACFKLYPMYSISIWKDTPFSLALFLYTLTIIDLILDFKNKHIKIANIIKLNIYAILISFLRSNGIYIAILSYLILSATFIIKVFKDKNFKNVKIFNISSMGIIVCILIIQSLYPKFGIEKTEFVENLAIPLQQIARVVATDGNISDEQKAQIEKIVPIDVIKTKYRAMLVDPIKWDSKFDEEYLEEHKQEFFKLWFELLIQNPGEYINAYLLETSGFWSFNVKGEEAFISPIIWETLNDKMQNQDLIAQNSPNHISLRNDLLKVPYYSGGLFFWITAVSMLVAFNTCEKKYLIGYLPSIVLWLTVMVATPMASALRYVYIFVLILPLNLIYPAIIKNANLD